MQSPNVPIISQRPQRYLSIRVEHFALRLQPNLCFLCFPRVEPFGIGQLQLSDFVQVIQFTWKVHTCGGFGTEVLDIILREKIL